MLREAEELVDTNPAALLSRQDEKVNIWLIIEKIKKNKAKLESPTLAYIVGTKNKPVTYFIVENKYTLEGIGERGNYRKPSTQIKRTVTFGQRGNIIPQIVIGQPQSETPEFQKSELKPSYNETEKKDKIKNIEKIMTNPSRFKKADSVSDITDIPTVAQVSASMEHMIPEQTQDFSQAKEPPKNK
ncbi:hypothetical protein HZS_4976 [Henneguya salminicola]|nr:hypothetical protein HZS_4976 [Henneguya salminicola]